MDVKVFYVKFNGEKVNAGGWSSKYGQLVLDITFEKDGCIPAKNIKKGLQNNMYKFMGTMHVDDKKAVSDAIYEEVYAKLQNTDYNTSQFGRSMSIGDIIMRDGGEIHVVVGDGFQQIVGEEIFDQLKQVEYLFS